MFNAQERTLREIVRLARSAGWRVTKVTRAQGSLFGHILAVPCEVPAGAEKHGAPPSNVDKKNPDLTAITQGRHRT